MVKPQFELGRERVGKGRRPRPRRPARGDPHGRPRRQRARPAGPRLRLLGPARAEGQPRDLRLVRRRRRGRRRPRGGDAWRWSREQSDVAALITHSHPPATTEAVELVAARRRRGRLAAGRDRRTRSPSTAPPAAGIEAVESLPHAGRPLPRPRRRRLDPLRAAALRPHRRPGLRRQLRHRRLPRRGRARRGRGGHRTRPRRRDRDGRPARARGRDRRRGRGSASTTSASSAARTTGSPS